MGEQAEQAVSSAGGTATIHGTIPADALLPRAGRMSLGPVPAGLRFHLTAMSHGWCTLPPTAYDEGKHVLYRTLDLPDAGVVAISIAQGPDGKLVASWPRVKGSCDDRIAIKASARRMLALDDDLTELYAICDTIDGLAWVRTTSVGRLLRSPTVFEDLVKTLTTTNCSWALTKIMCRRIVDTLGNNGAFPTAAAMAAADERHYRDEIRSGYRARAFVELADKVASGDLGEERWLDPVMSDADVLAEIRTLRGFGPYAAENMLGLLGRPRGLAIDSWVRGKLPGLLGRKKMTDKQIAYRYKKLGRWAGTGLWLELTRDWFEAQQD